MSSPCKKLGQLIPNDRCDDRGQDVTETKRAEIVSYSPLPELREYTPSVKYVPPTLYRQFTCTLSDGMRCVLWLEVDRRNTFRPIFN